MGATTAKRLGTTSRYMMQNAKQSVRDICDAITELVTNVDDRYQILGKAGRIEIEIERHRGSPHILRVRDFADGMTSDTMDLKLSNFGKRVSGLESGEQVRGTNSRGAKDVAALGPVTFESIAEDGQYHVRSITEYFDFDQSHASKRVTAAIRKKLGIPRGTGTVVAVELKNCRVSLHDNLRKQISQVVSLRDILSDKNRQVVLRDLSQDRRETIRPPKLEGQPRVKTSFEIPGYPGSKAKLIIKRAKTPFNRKSDRFRLGGILIKSRHAIHEATLFDSKLENDHHAARFFGRLVCPFIDELWNDYDDRWEDRRSFEKDNSVPIIDPLRRTGLTREHPFVKALFGEVLKRLRPLVEEERRREEMEHATIENQATRKRLNNLEKAATKFLDKYQKDDDFSRDPNSSKTESIFKKKGYTLSPPFVQIIRGHSQQFWLNINQEVFPELEVGTAVQIECLSPEIAADKRFCGLEAHPARQNVIRALWKVRGVTATPATGVRVRVGPISDESAVEVLDSEADKYSHVETLCFSKKRYRLRTDSKRKKLLLLAPLHLVPTKTPFEVSSSSANFLVGGERILRPNSELGVSVCRLHLRAKSTASKGVLTATLGETSASAEVQSTAPLGSGIKIKLKDIDLENQRAQWRHNLLEVAARHPSLRRYLGDKASGFVGQDAKHFRLLLAEIVAESVCQKLVSQLANDNPEDYEDADWDLYYAEYSRLMTEFLPIAHTLQVPDTSV